MDLRLSGRRGFVACCLALLAIFAFGLWLRWPLSQEGLWRDEAIAVAIARAPTVRDLLQRNQYLDSHPPLFYLSVRAWSAIAGDGETALAVFALSWGLLAVLAVGWLAFQSFGPVAALLAAFLAACQTLMVQMAGELRSYSMASALSAAAIALSLRVLKAPPGTRPSLARTLILAAVFTVTAYSNYAGTLVIGVIGLAAILMRLRKTPEPGWTAILWAAAMSGVTFLVWLPTVLRHARIGLPWDLPRSLDVRLLALGGKVVDILPGPEDGWTVASRVTCCAGGVLFLAAALLGRRSARPAAPSQGVLLVGLAGAAVFLVMGSLGGPTRYLSTATALFCALGGGLLCLLASAAARGGPVARGTSCLGALLLLGSFVASAATERDQWNGYVGNGVFRSGIRALCGKSSFARGDLLVVAPDYLATTVRYYCGPNPTLHGFVQWEHPELPDWEHYTALLRSDDGASEAAARIAKTAAPLGGFWLVWGESPSGPPLFYPRRIARLREALKSRFHSGGAQLFRGRVESVFLERFDLAGGPPPAGLSKDRPSCD